MAEAKAADLTDALIAAVAPVKNRVGRCGRRADVEERRSGIMAWEKMNPALLHGGYVSLIVFNGNVGGGYTWDSQWL
jgi:hypothetical protein